MTRQIEDGKEVLIVLPARLAVYCENCRQITNSPGSVCVACDSKEALLNLSVMLNREPA